MSDFTAGAEFRRKVQEDIDGFDNDARLRAAKGKGGSYVFRQDDSCPPEACRFKGGVCTLCKLRDGAHEETTRMIELMQEIEAGVPLQPGQLGADEIAVLAMLRDRKAAQMAAMSALKGALGG